MATTGKKDPCICGSGLAYEDCCYNEDVLHGKVPGGNSPAQEILSGLEDRVYSSLDEVREAARRVADASNRRPLDEFCGLSPEDMYRFLHHPFNSPDVVSFNPELRQFPEAPFCRLFPFLLQAAAQEKLKATAKGMLPVKFVRDAARWYYGEEKYLDRSRAMTYRTETDFSVLHTVRLVAGLSGFLRKVKGSFSPTKEGFAFAEKGLDGASFLRVFETYTRKFNWGYNDRYPELHIIQHAFLFTLYTLSKFGEEWRPATFYEDLFLTAFPAALRDAPQRSFETPEQTLKHCFSVRALERFAHFFGFVEFDAARKRTWQEPRLLRKTPFLDDWVRFTPVAAQVR
jgi:hypothetical protein